MIQSDRAMDSPARPSFNRAMTDLLLAVTLIAAMGCGVVAGVFFAFSAFVMGALTRLPTSQGIAAMQSINRQAVRPPLMTALFGTALLCAGLAAWALLDAWGEDSTVWLIAGSGLYLIGTVVLTMVANVPRNEALAAVDPHETDAASRWLDYVAGWTAWNHVRGAAALAAAALLTVALGVGWDGSGAGSAR